jgi:hypothetical protein
VIEYKKYLKGSKGSNKFSHIGHPKPNAFIVHIPHYSLMQD